MPDKCRFLIPEQIDTPGPESIRDIVESTTEYRTTEDVRERIGEFDAIILRGIQLDADLIEAADNLKLISKHGVGLDSVDIDGASERGIVVCNTPQANSRTVAEATIMLLLATRRNVVQADQAVRAGDWNARADWDRFRRHTIEDDTLGLYGFGNIAREVAKMAVGMGMRCVTYDPYIRDEDLLKGVSGKTDKQSLFEAADVVSVHAPLTNETHRAVGIEELREIDYLINTARGEIVDEEGLRQALNEDLVAAGLDVLNEEPPSADNPLLKRDDVVLTPHFGTLSVAALQLMSEGAAKNVRAVYEGEIPNSAVNSEKI